MSNTHRIMDAFFPYAETTQQITVRVAVTFHSEKSDPEMGQWFWCYHIRVENNGRTPVQLLTRRWTIADGRGALFQREGRGVVGEEPVIQPGAAYDYVSGCPLSTPTGWMEGSYMMLEGGGSSIEVRIPRFALLAPAVSG
jgi:ApaG protein